MKVSAGIEYDLRVLEFGSVPAPDALQTRFKELLKRYHPDRNPDRVDWAHEKTRQLLESSARLREYLNREAPNTARTAGGHRGPGRSATPAWRAEAAKARRDEIAYQLIEGELGNFALPVRDIISIAPLSAASITRNLLGDFCSHGGLVFPILTLDGEPLRIDQAEFAVLVGSGQNRAAVAVYNDMRFVSIENFSEHERVYLRGKRAGEGAWLLYRGKYYRCPRHLVRS